MERNLSFDMIEVNGFPTKLAQCRICHDEDEPSNMEAPCACCGSLKNLDLIMYLTFLGMAESVGIALIMLTVDVYRCGATKRVTLCVKSAFSLSNFSRLQQFRPGYTVPPPRLPFAIIPVPLRDSWEFARNNHFSHPSFVAADNFFDHRFDDYTVPTASIICCRIVTIIFMILVILRHTIPIVYNGAGEYSFALYTLLMLRTIAILLPMFVMLKACSILRHHRRHRQAPPAFVHTTSDDENEFVQPQVSAHFIHIQ
ncbi:putative nicotinate phosphoribosyltransferase [Bienertia sinuspersici]